MSGEWMNHCFSQWEKTAGSFSRPAAAVGALLGGYGGYDLAKSVGPHRGARALAAGAGALSSGLLAGAGVGGLQDGHRAVKKERAARASRAHFDPLIRSARWKWEDREKNRISQKRYGTDHEDSPLEQEDYHKHISDPVFAQADAHQAKVKHLPRSKQLEYWRGLAGTKTAGQLIKAVASPVIGAGKMIGNRVVEKPISTIMGAKAVHSLAKGTIGTVRAARGDIQNAQNQHGTPTQAQHMGARQPRPNPARISQTGSY